MFSQDAHADSSTHVVPTINISEPEDLQATQSVEAMKLIEKPTGFRPRAKSYPAIEQQLTPMLELPQRVNQRSIKSLATNATLSNKVVIYNKIVIIIIQQYNIQQNIILYNNYTTK